MAKEKKPKKPEAISKSTVRHPGRVKLDEFPKEDQAPESVEPETPTPPAEPTPTPDETETLTVETPE